MAACRARHAHSKVNSWTRAQSLIQQVPRVRVRCCTTHQERTRDMRPQECCDHTLASFIPTCAARIAAKSAAHPRAHGSDCQSAACRVVARLSLSCTLAASSQPITPHHTYHTLSRPFTLRREPSHSIASRYTLSRAVTLRREPSHSVTTGPPGVTRHSRCGLFLCAVRDAFCGRFSSGLAEQLAFLLKQRFEPSFGLLRADEYVGDHLV